MPYMICHISVVSYKASDIISHISDARYYKSHKISDARYYMSHNISDVRCQTSNAIYYMSHIRCQMPDIRCPILYLTYQMHVATYQMSDNMFLMKNIRWNILYIE